MSLLDVLKEEVTRKRNKRIVLAVPDLPNELLFRRATADDIARCQKSGYRLSPKDEFMAQFYANLALIATCCTEIWVNGETFMLESGDPATFTDREVQAFWGVATASEAVRAQVGDGAAVSIAVAVLRESGFEADGTPLQGEENPI